MTRYCCRSSKADQPRGIQRDDALVADDEIDRFFRCDLARQGHDRFGKLARVVDVGGIGLGEELHGRACAGLGGGSDHAPVQAGRNLEHGQVLRLRGVIPQRDCAAYTEALLRRFEAHVQIVVRDGEGFAVEGVTTGGQGQHREQYSQSAHFRLDAASEAASRRCRTIS